MLDNRDYTLIIDKSGSMATPDQKGGRTRWVAAEESTFALASKCEQFDPDGITIYTFSGRFKRYENVTSNKVMQVFRENDPSGTTDLASVLKDATDNYFKRKDAGETKLNGETILVITDGEPDDRKAVMKVIIETSRRMDKDEELAISFIQVGKDPHATRFLKVLDDEMQSAGAKFDICDTITMDEMEDYSLSEVLLNAIID
ncbi:von Willebrand factor type A [Calothrix parasitica NIES-267]|uniref:von Willebrand factor type A n=1 Tax=Calothrix parasitica NIES-267 TaxID=1973488 RepID=A0A1Z4M070_9CYAN|nr:von Willebrand factor type A [Calothrix parasitica NIES-267]